MTLTEILDKIPGTHIAVVGDAMVDHYVFGRVERICPEAPVPIFVPESRESRPGGAANVARQLIELGCQVYQSFAPEFCIKTRYMAGQQLVLRVDEDKMTRPTPDNVEAIAGFLAGLKQLDAVILSDYAKGWLSPDMCKAIIREAAQRKVPAIVDPKGGDWSKYLGCELICPNEKEFVEGRGLYDVLLKRGARGMTLFECAELTVDIPTTARHVYDVTGAGDTVVAVVAAAIAVGASKLEAATLAALAAGYVVGEVGTTVCSHEKLKELIDARN